VQSSRSRAALALWDHSLARLSNRAPSRYRHIGGRSPAHAPRRECVSRLSHRRVGSTDPIRIASEVDIPSGMPFTALDLHIYYID